MNTLFCQGWLKMAFIVWISSIKVGYESGGDNSRTESGKRVRIRPDSDTHHWLKSRGKQLCGLPVKTYCRFFKIPNSRMYLWLTFRWGGGVKPPDIGGSPPPSAPRLDSFIVFHSLPSITVIAWKKEHWLRILTVGQQTTVQIADPVETGCDK
jgi:hypothetical protein